MNKAHGSLMRLEMSRHRMWSPIYRPRAFGVVALMLILATVIVERWHVSFLGVVYFGAYLTTMVSFGVSVSVFGSVHSAEKMWTLGLPLSRRTILSAKLLASGAVVARTIVLFWGSMAISTAILIAASHGTVIVRSSDIVEALFVLILSLCSSIAVVSLTGFTPLFHYGWWRLGYVFMWFAIIGWWIPLLNGEGLKPTDRRLMTSGGIMLLIAIVSGALLYQFASAVLRAPAKQTGANRQYGRPERKARSEQTMRVAEVRKTKSMSPFWAVVWLEFSRSRLWQSGATRVNQVIMMIALLLIACVSGVSMGFGHSFSGVVVGAFTFISASGMIGYYIILLRSTMDGYNKWFVGFPIAPVKLIGARAMAYYLRFLTVAALALASVGLGVGAVAVIHPTLDHWVSGLQVLWHAVMLTVLFTAIVFTVLTGGLTFLRKGPASVVLLGFMYVAALETNLMWFPRLYLHPGRTYWIVVLAVVVVGVPVAVWSLRFAATHINRLAQSVVMKNSPWASWSKWGNPS